MRQLSSLKFAQLRIANRARLPQFRNSMGGLAHSKSDGSDWTPNQWLGAAFGELGELCRVREMFDEGKISYEEMCREVSKEVADVQTYLDLASSRLLDRTTETLPLERDPEALMLRIIAELGDFANIRKKHLRGDFTNEEFQQRRGAYLSRAQHFIGLLEALKPEAVTGQLVSDAHPSGVDLGAATLAKFNEASKRVGANVFLHEDDPQVRIAA